MMISGTVRCAELMPVFFLEPTTSHGALVPFTEIPT